MSEQSKLEQNKELVRRFYLTCVVRADFGNWRELVREDYIQHSPLAENGVEGLRKFATGYLEQYPEVTLEFKRIVAEGDLVVTHSHVVRYPGDNGVSVMDIFRVEDGLVAEHWEAFVPVPDATISGQGLF